ADPFKCGALLNHGQWLDSPELTPEGPPFRTWQPPGCILHDYTLPDIADCSGTGRIVFVGDTLVRQLFWATARKIEGDSRWVFNEQAKHPGTHNDLSYDAGGVKLRFIWDPWLNSSALAAELKTFKTRLEPPKLDLSTGTYARSARLKETSLMLIGGGHWHARHLGGDSVARFKHAVDNITASAYPEGLVRGAKILRPSGSEGVGDQIFVAPVLEPLYSRLSPAREATIAPQKINDMNEYLHHMSSQGRLTVPWSYANMTRNHSGAYGESGLHVIANVAGRMANVVLNVRCNGKATQRDDVLRDRTCCTSSWTANWVTYVCRLVLGLFTLFDIWKSAKSQPEVDPIRHDKFIVRQRTVSPPPGEPAGWAYGMHSIAYALWWCLLNDRTDFVDKSAKVFRIADFGALVMIGSAICLITLQGNSRPVDRKRSTSLSRPATPHTFLQRAQSDEFKGWMQLYVLAYSYVGASSRLELYEVLRIIIALYLFLSAYGHTVYLLQNRNYSLQRVAAVLLRRNGLPVLLSLILGRPYLSYHFAPLVSFWFLVVFVTLRIAEHRNRSLRFLLGKVFFSASIATCFIHVRGILEVICAVIGFLCASRAKIDAQEWRHRLAMDKYIIYVGMIVAITHLWVCSILNTPQLQPNRLTRSITTHFNYYRAFFVIAALILGPVFWIVSRAHTNSRDYDSWTPFLSWMPVLSLVILRNATQMLREYHFAGLAWLGKMSLEVHLLSQHTWMAGDGGGLLKVSARGGDGSLWNDRWRDLVILTPILLSLAWRASGATKVVTDRILEVPQFSTRTGSSAALVRRLVLIGVAVWALKWLS
ncbi:Cas1p-domain-containing protein, partial [Lophiostoma macrostomum CBS 122681]